MRYLKEDVMWHVASFLLHHAGTATDAFSLLRWPLAHTQRDSPEGSTQ